MSRCSLPHLTEDTVRHWFSCSIAIVGVAIAAPARAQIVNVQPTVARDQPEGWSGEVNAALHQKTGNTSLLDVAGNALAGFRAGDDRIVAIARGRHAAKSDRAFIQQTFAHVRYRHDVRDWLGLETYAQHERDRFRALELRALGGAGPRFALQPHDAVDLALGLAYLFEHVEERGHPLHVENAHRASSYVYASLTHGMLRLTHTSYVQPRLDDAHDARFLSETAIAIAHGKHLALKVAYVAQADTHPPPGVHRLDTSLETSLVAAF